MEEHNQRAFGDMPHESSPDGAANQPDEQVLYDHVTKTLADGSPIDHTTAHCIAVLLHEAEGTSLERFSSSGGVPDLSALRGEIAVWRQEGPSELDTWFDALVRYLNHRSDQGPVDGWRELWPPPERGTGQAV